MFEKKQFQCSHRPPPFNFCQFPLFGDLEELNRGIIRIKSPYLSYLRTPLFANRDHSENTSDWS